MKILSVASVFPERSLTNEMLLDAVERASRRGFVGDFAAARRLLVGLLRAGGFRSRFRFAPEERPLDAVERAFRSALTEAELGVGQIDLLLYAGVARGFLEPASSAFVARALGLSCRNYDVVDACMGWFTALEVADAAMKAGTVRYAVVVNVERAQYSESDYRLVRVEDLSRRFAAFTVGDAVTVTVLSADAPDNFAFHVVTRTELSHLTTFALPNWTAFCDVDDFGAHASPTPETFQCFGAEVSAAIQAGSKTALEGLQGSGTLAVARVFTHTSLPTLWSRLSREAGLGGEHHSVGEWTGNVVSASIPCALAHARGASKLSRGERCLAWLAGGGMSFGAATFEY